MVQLYFPAWGRPPNGRDSWLPFFEHLANRTPRGQLHQWLTTDFVGSLSSPQRAAFIMYAQDCEAWYHVLQRSLERPQDEPDWLVTPAANAPVNKWERKLEVALVEAGLSVEGQVGVSPSGGVRCGGWYGNWWLDYALRDYGYLLKVAIELDGPRHAYEYQQWKDSRRNNRLTARGWYVFRVPIAVVGDQREHESSNLWC